MKAFKKILLFVVLWGSLSPPILTQTQAQTVPSVNGWRYTLNLASLPDYSKTKSFFSNNHNSQIFANYGYTTYPRYWNHQGTWVKDFSLDFLDVFTTPDTVFFDCRLFLGIPMEKIKSVEVFLALEGSNKWVFDASQSQYIPLDGSWKRLYWDMKWAKDFGLTSFYRLYLAFAVHTADSIYVGTEVEADNLGGFYNNPKKTIVYDSFGDITDVPRGNFLPSEFVLSQNYPNPFNPTTKIQYFIPIESGPVTLKVYDLLGREVATLVDNEQKPAGIYEATFNASNLSSGAYFYELRTRNFVERKKMSLVK